MKAQKTKTERKRLAPNGTYRQHLHLAGLLNSDSSNGQMEGLDVGGIPATTSHDKSIEPAWVKKCSRRAPDWKRVIANYAATHLIGYGDVIQLGSGTTFNALMDKVIERQLVTEDALDLIVLTSNLQVLAKGRDAQSKDQRLFGTMQIILTGGSLNMSLDSLTGEYAAKGVNSEFIFPTTTFFGASGLSFRDELTIRYQFEEEISTQVAYATRPTNQRVLLCDHTKLGRKVGLNAGLSIEKLLLSTEKCLVISTFPDSESPESEQEIKMIEQEGGELEGLLHRLLDEDTASLYHDKEFALRLINPQGEVKKEISLSELRRKRKRD
jgi:DeoR/GlpR family transcriptional regulator of sugar metabolism